jgi:2,4-dienoyl-CoA reductase-like NADH-dependent reductase (Old Yellow Enzyme family)
LIDTRLTLIPWQSNLRTDDYGGTPEKRAKIVVDIIKATRAAVHSNFCVGIKLNSADLDSPAELEDTMRQIELIVEAGIDFLEVSGGSFEDPKVRLYKIQTAKIRLDQKK